MSSPDFATFKVEAQSLCPTLETNVPFSVFVELTKAEIILNAFASSSVRVHRTLLLLHPASTLWYLCRGLDIKNQGWMVLSEQQWRLLGKGRSTICRWLFEGKKLGFFWCYSWQGNTLKIRLGGLRRVCRVSNIMSWGAVGVVPIPELLAGNSRAIACAITTQDLQQKSHYAARRQLNKQDRQTFDVPTVEQLLDDSQTSQQFTRGEICGVIGTGDSRMFVNQRFIPFGVSQQKVCDTLNSEPTSCGVSPRTLRRHLDSLGVVKRQLVQTKPEYREIRTNFKNPLATSFTCHSDKNIHCQIRSDVRLYEPNGITSSRREEGHVVIGDKLQRKPYFGVFWMHRCNLYRLDLDLTSMKYCRYLWKKERLKTTAAAAETSPEMAETLIIPAQPPALLGRGAADENKADKNEIPSNADSDVVSDDIPPCVYEMKQKLLERQRLRKQARTEALVTGSMKPINEYWRQMRERSH